MGPLGTSHAVGVPLDRALGGHATAGYVEGSLVERPAGWVE